MDTQPSSRPTWKVVVAALLDFFLVFFAGGMVIGRFTGQATDTGFNLNGMPAVLLFVVVTAYFWLGKRSGGTVFRRLFGIAP